MHGIDVAASAAGTKIDAWGEFDGFSLPGLRAALDDACALGGAVVVDLSGITFLDLRSARELVVRAMIQGHQISFQNPSPNVLASIRALGINTGPAHEEPPVFSGA